MAMSPLAERLIDEGLRMSRHPMIVFRDGPAGRRAVLMAGPEVVDVVTMIVGSQIPVDERSGRAADHLGITVAQVDAALHYYAEHTDEVDAEIAARDDAAEMEEALWRRRRQLLEA